MSAKACVECRWNDYSPGAGERCLNPEAATRHPVIGYTNCWKERAAAIFSKRCGPKGRLFEPKATGGDQ
jgi:hypothetical protein